MFIVVNDVDLICFALHIAFYNWLFIYKSTVYTVSFYEYLFLLSLWLDIFRSSCLKLLCEKCASKSFRKIHRKTGKHLCHSLFFSKEDPTQVSSCEFCKIFKNTSSYRKPPMAGSTSPRTWIFARRKQTLTNIPNKRFPKRFSKILKKILPSSCKLRADNLQLHKKLFFLHRYFPGNLPKISQPRHFSEYLWTIESSI